MELLFSEATNSRCSKVDPGLLQYQRWSSSWQYLRLSTIATKSSIVDAVTVSLRSTSEILFGCKSFLFIEVFYFCFSQFDKKKWEKLRNRYLWVKRELREKNISGTGTVSLKNAKQKMEELNFLLWMESFIKPRQSRGTYTSIKKCEKEEPVFEDPLEPGENTGL